MVVIEIRELFNDMLHMEIDVRDRYLALIDKLEDGATKGILQKILADEYRHIGNVQQILRILDE